MGYLIGVVLFVGVLCAAAIVQMSLLMTVVLMGVYMLGIALSFGIASAMEKEYGGLLASDDLEFAFIMAWPISWPCYFVYKIGYLMIMGD
jgi:hypothetical protein